MLYQEGPCDTGILAGSSFVSPGNLVSCAVWTVCTDTSHRCVRIDGSDSRYLVPGKDQHNCCEDCGNCDTCELCVEFDPGQRPPQELQDVIALFPNATRLDIEWQVSDDGHFELEPTHTGEQLRNLKHLRISLKSHEWTTVYHSRQAAEANMILASLHMPSLESIAIAFSISNDGFGYADDFVSLRDALCEIESDRLRKVSVSADVPFLYTTFPAAWVSTILLDRAVQVWYLLKHLGEPQSAVADLITTVVKTSKISTFKYHASYFLEEDVDDLYTDFFIQTNEGAFISPSFVPDKAAFTHLVRQTEAARTEGNAGCSIAVTIDCNIPRYGCLLVEASYDTSRKTATSISRLFDLQPSIDSRYDTTSQLIDETGINFRRDPASHARLKSLLIDEDED
jgi:hypothetical protein